MEDQTYKTYLLGICKLAFKDKSIMIIHMNSVHEQMKKPFKVKGEKLVQKYIKEISSGKLPKCPMCKVAFKDLGDLNDLIEMFCTDCKTCVKSEYITV